MTNTEKIAFLDSVVIALHKSIYRACAISGVEMDGLNLETFNSVEFLSSYPDNLPQPIWMARNIIIQDIQKLIAVNKKLDELKNA